MSLHRICLTLGPAVAFCMFPEMGSPSLPPLLSGFQEGPQHGMRGVALGSSCLQRHIFVWPWTSMLPVWFPGRSP